jgi:histidinol-phosphate/aromatic aminotransferase/cobyric acid decarboxylase-like protein
MQAREEIAHTPLVEHGGRFASLESPPAGPAVVDFSTCLNAYGPAPVVVDAVRNARIDEYPDRFSKAARHAAAYRWDRPLGEVVFGAGAAELIQAVCFAYINRGDNVVVAEPAFGEYARAAKLCGAEVHSARTVPGNDEIALWDGVMNAISNVLRTSARLLFVASPTSPAGGQYHLQMLQLLADTCKKCDCLLVLDQSYDGFVEHPTGTPALGGHSHIVHLRSLTKDHALAGVRVAYAVAPEHIAQDIERARVPWSSSTAAQAAAVACMSESAIEHARRTTTELRAHAQRIASHCATINLPVVTSATHYLLIECGNAAQARADLIAHHGVLVRDGSSFGLRDQIRVAARTPAENGMLLGALSALVAAGHTASESSINTTTQQSETHG